MRSKKGREITLGNVCFIVYPLPKFYRICINNSLHLAGKYAPIFVRGHYLFQEASSFPRTSNCNLCETDNVQGQIRKDIFTSNGGYCVYYSSNIFRNTRSFENWGIFSDMPQF